MLSRKQIEFLVGIFGYVALYLLVLDPLVAATTPFDKAPLADSASRGATLVRILTTARGWLFVLGFLPAMIGFVTVRARLADARVAEFWNG